MASNKASNVDLAVKLQLDEMLLEMENRLDSDVLALSSPIIYGLEHRIRFAIEALEDNRRETLTIILTTNGGIVQVVERIVDTIRHFYPVVNFVVPDVAMSAGTILALSGDNIYMDYFSRLGPIDPQIEKDGRLVPALSYLVQYERLIEKANAGRLSVVEAALIQKLDLADLHSYEQAKELSITLLKKWLSLYKFKNWIQTDERKLTVTHELREERAKEIAEALNDPHQWHSHARGISMDVLRTELKLQIENLDEQKELNAEIKRHYSLQRDYMQRHEYGTFVHTREFF